MDERTSVWREADLAFSKALDLPEGEREAFLEGLGLRDEVCVLAKRILQAAQGTGPLDRTLGFGTESPFDSSTLVGRRIGPWTLEAEIGRGGASVVFRAHREEFDQPAALKILTMGQFVGDGPRRWRREQRLLAQLQHPNIATMLDAGRALDGTPYIAMELVDGEPIDVYVDRLTLEPRATVDLFLQLGAAVEFAHRNLIIHRDIKPSNILVTPDGTVKLLDFGIARLAEAGEREGTVTLALTPGYGAPEQVAGHPVSTATDVFGLGAVLYRLLTGKGAFPRSLEPTYTAPVPPRELVPNLDRDLQNILMMAIREAPDRRYPTVPALTDDLRNWLRNRPILATPDGVGYRAAKFVQRNRWALGAGAVALAIATAGIAATLWQARKATRQGAVAKAQHELASAQNEFLIDLFQEANLMRPGAEDPKVSSLLSGASAQARVQLRDQPIAQAGLLRVIGTAQRELGRLDEAQGSLDAGWEAIVRAGAESSLEAAHILRSLAWQDYEAGNLAESVERMRRAMALFRDLLPPDHPEFPTLEVDLAELVWTENPGEALQLADRVAEALRASPDGSEDPLLAHALRAKGMALDELDRSDEAIAALRESVEWIRAHDAPGSVRLASHLNELGVAYSNAGRHDQSTQAWEECLQIYSELYGDAHQRSVSAMSNLSHAYGQLGRTADAGAIARRALEASIQFHGPDHPTSARAWTMYAVGLSAPGQVAERLNAFEQGIAILRRHPEHGYPLANALSMYSGAWVTSGEPSRGIEPAREALELFRNTASQSDIRVPLTKLRLGRAHLGAGDNLSAAQALEGVEREFLEHRDPSMSDDWKREQAASSQLLRMLALARAGDLDAARIGYRPLPEPRTDDQVQWERQLRKLLGPPTR